MSLRLLAILILLVTVAASAPAATWFAVPPSGSGSSSPISIPLVFAETPSDIQGYLPVADLAGGAMHSPSASTVAADPIAPAQSSDGSAIVKLAAPPAALFLMVQGLAFICLIRGRRKWILIVFAMISLGRAGLHALPRIFTLESESAPPARTSSASQPLTQHDGQRLASEARTASLDYVWMLRRAHAEPLLSRSTFEQAASHTVAVPGKGRAADIFVPLSLHPEPTAADRPLPAAFLPRETSPPLSRDPILFSLFARLPPAILG